MGKTIEKSRFHYSEDIMKHIIANSRTISEKRCFYTKDQEVDESYLNNWRDVNTLLNDNYFNKMLSIENMTKEEFGYAIQPNDDITYTKEEEQWFNEFLNIINKFPYESINYTDGINISYLPFLYDIKNHIDNCISELNNISIDERVIISFCEAAQLELFDIFGKLIAVELELYKQSHNFRSEDKEERFKEFLESFYDSKNSFINFYAKYPVATRVAMVRVEYMKKNIKNLLQRVEDDYQELSKFLNLNQEKLQLTEIRLSTGDSHEQGNAVSILKFGEKKVAYKPKNLKISESLQYFLNWCSGNSDLLDLKLPKGIYRDEYSYVEFIEKSHCRSQAEIESFYTRYGYLTAICYLLGINDLHMENVIAMGEYPVIVDIETMFQVSPKFENENLYSNILRLLNVDSVSNSCLLPTKINIGLDGDIELSAFNGKEAKTNSKVLGPVNINTDEFRFEKQDAYFSGGDNIPMIDDTKEVDFNNYRLLILEGFNDYMCFVMNHKQEFLEKLTIFKGKIIRSLIKGTDRYASMIRYANHPNYNTEMKFRERLMMNIWAYPYFDKRIISSEIRDLLYNDIPIFYAISDSRNIIDSHGKVYKDYFERSGFELTVERVKNLDKEVLKRQQVIMITSLGLADNYLNEKMTVAKTKTRPLSSHYYNYIKEAENIAEKLIAEILETKNEASFINIECDDNLHWKVIPCDESFYGGLSGIALFFLVLYRNTKKDKYLHYYKKLIHTAIKQSKLHPFQSAFNGWLSPVYPMLFEYEFFGTLADEEFLKLTIENINSLSKDDIDKIPNTDYISGIAGMIRLIDKIKLVSHIGEISYNILELFANALNERLLRQNEKSFTRVGIAHGLSGVALSLLSAPNIDKELIIELLIKEMNLQVKEKDTYKWCWGISGMIQARIEILKTIPDSRIEDQLQILIKQYEYLLHYIPKSDTICHGKGSVLTTMKNILQYTNDNRWLKRMDVVFSNMRENSLLDDYFVPRILHLEMKGLFDGISGIGLTYLNAVSDIPNFLLLNPK